MDAAYLSWLAVAMVLVGGIVGVTYVVRNDPIFQTANQFTDPSNAFVFALAHRFLPPKPPSQDDKEMQDMIWGFAKIGVGLGLALLMFTIHRIRARTDTPNIDGADAVKTYETLMETERLRLDKNLSREEFEKEYPDIRDTCMKATTKVHEDPGVAAAFRDKIEEQAKFLSSMSEDFKNGKKPTDAERKAQEERDERRGQKEKGLAGEILDGISPEGTTDEPEEPRAEG